MVDNTNGVSMLRRRIKTRVSNEKVKTVVYSVIRTVPLVGMVQLIEIVNKEFRDPVRKSETRKRSLALFNENAKVEQCQAEVIKQPDVEWLRHQVFGMHQTQFLHQGLDQFQQIRHGRSYVLHAKCDRRRKEEQNKGDQM